MADVTRTVITKVEIDNKQAVKAQKTMEDQNQETTDSTLEYGSALDGVLDQFGPLGGAVKSAVTGLKNFSTGAKGSATASKLLTTAMKAIPIVLLVTALTSLFAFLTRTQQGMDLVSDAFAVAKAVMDQVLNTLAGVGSGFVAILQGNFREGISQIGDSFGSMAGNIANASKETLRLEQAQRDLDERMRGIRVLQAQLNTAVAENILLSKDQTLSEEERLEAIRIAQQQQEIINAQQVEFAEQELQLLRDNNALKKINGKLTDDQRDAEIDLVISVEKARKTAADSLKKIQATQQALEKSIADARQKEHEAWLKRREERRIALEKEQLEQLEAHRATLNQIDETINFKKQGLKDEREDTEFTLDFKKKATETTDEGIQLQQDHDRDAKRKNDLRNFAEVSETTLEGAFDLQVSLAELGIEGGKLGKALALTQTIINTARAIVSAAGTQPFFPLGLIATATAAAIGVAQIAAIKRTKTMARGGMVQGPGHQYGGVKFSVGGRVNELEGGEAVINRRNSSKFRPLLSAINSHGGNGVKFGYGGMVNRFQTGGMLESGLNNLDQTLETAIQNSPPIMILEDFNEAAARAAAVEDIASAG